MYQTIFSMLNETLVVGQVIKMEVIFLFLFQLTGANVGLLGHIKVPSCLIHWTI